MALGSGGDFKGFWTSGGLGRRILKDFLALGASWPRSELSRAGGLSSFNSFNFLNLFNSFNSLN